MIQHQYRWDVRHRLEVQRDCAPPQVCGHTAYQAAMNFLPLY